MANRDLTPTMREESLAYEILRPAPWHRSPRQHVAMLVAEYREVVCEELERVARRVPECAEEIRGVIARLREDRGRVHG